MSTGKMPQVSEQREYDPSALEGSRVVIGHRELTNAEEELVVRRKLKGIEVVTDLRDLALAEAVDQLGDWSGVPIVFAANAVSLQNAKAKCESDVRRMMLGDALRTILKPAALSFTISGRFIVIGKQRLKTHD